MGHSGRHWRGLYPTWQLIRPRYPRRAFRQFMSHYHTGMQVLSYSKFDRSCHCSLAPKIEGRGFENSTVAQEPVAVGISIIFRVRHSGLVGTIILPFFLRWLALATDSVEHASATSLDLCQKASH